MGVPKFYRWLSERYPTINENINQNNVPEFDNFYVDMNGVFHNCSHPSDDVHFRIPEPQIFENIGTYINFLFHLIRPRKLFFLSVDGVAPRSKMNQQRSRRFKSAKEAIEKETRAKQMGETLPSDPRFDSNCITPGTEFMAKLHSYMIDFLSDKIQNCQEWGEVKIIYSGYDVPGEGEHKIMDYIRMFKTSNSFEPDTRHCIYGLDADLINLGLSTHEPYFSVLREEVSFSKNKQIKHCDPVRTNFQFLHLSLLREYIYYEFEELKDKMKFEFNLEKIIDDWILVNFLIGNDFLPHVPKFHINRRGVQYLYDAYKAILPKLDGYLNDNGKLVMGRYKKFLTQLSEYDFNLFNEKNFDFKILDQANEITFGSGVDFGEDFDFKNTSSEKESDDYLDDSSCSLSDEDDEDNPIFIDEFTQHKNDYYFNKFKCENLSEIETISIEYLKGIQWVLHYYFDGCVSWTWFYPYHYAPFVTDLAKLNTDIKFSFELGRPFPPLVQLLAVLPQASKELLPKAFQKVTYHPNSPLIEYFPPEFETDLNEKVHDYEAIVLIPFVNDKILMDVYETLKDELSPEEKERNAFGYHHVLKYGQESPKKCLEQINSIKYPNVFDDKLAKNAFWLQPDHIFKGIRPEIRLGKFIGFPSLSGVHFKMKLELSKIKLFNTASQNESMMIHIQKTSYGACVLNQIASKYVESIVYINWPLMSEAKLVELLDSNVKYAKNTQVSISEDEVRMANISCKNEAFVMKNKRGIIIDSVDIMAKVLPLESQRYIITDGKLKLHKTWSKTPKYVPLDIVLFEKIEGNRTMPHYKSLNNVFKRNRSAYLIGCPYYGYKATVLKYLSHTNTVMSIVTATNEPDFSEIEDVYSFIMKNCYVSEGKLCALIKQNFSISVCVIRRVLGSIIVQFVNKKGELSKINIGLKLKYNHNSKRYITQGYSCMDGERYFFNLKKVQIILEDYYEKYPNVFDMVNREQKSVYEINDLFTDPLVTLKDKINDLFQLGQWINSLEYSKMPFTRADAYYVDTCVVEAMEERIETHMSLMHEEKQYKMELKPENFYLHEFVLKGNPLPDSKVDFQLYDRVVNINPVMVVRMGAKGTVIAKYEGDAQISRTKTNNTEENDEMNNLIIEVLFDETFEGGLVERSSQKNTFKMDASWLINISYGARNFTMDQNNFNKKYYSIQPVKGQSPMNNYPNNYSNQNNACSSNNINNDNHNNFGGTAVNHSPLNPQDFPTPPKEWLIERNKKNIKQPRKPRKPDKYFEKKIFVNRNREQN